MEACQRRGNCRKEVYEPGERAASTASSRESCRPASRPRSSSGPAWARHRPLVLLAIVLPLADRPTPLLGLDRAPQATGAFEASLLGGETREERKAVDEMQTVVQAVGELDPLTQPLFCLLQPTRLDCELTELEERPGLPPKEAHLAGQLGCPREQLDRLVDVALDPRDSAEVPEPNRLVFSIVPPATDFQTLFRERDRPFELSTTLGVSRETMQHVPLAPLVAQLSVKGEALLIEPGAAVELADDVKGAGERP